MLTELDYFAFLKLQKWCNAPLADYYAQQALLGKTRLWGLQEGGTAATLAITADRGRFTTLLYVATQPLYQRQGYASKLCQQLRQTLGKPLRLCLLTKEAAYPALCGLVRVLGCRFKHRSTFFSYAVDAGSFAKAEALQAVVARVMRGGRQCLAVSELSPGLLAKLQRSEGHELNPAEFLANPLKGLDRELSYVLLKDDVIEAYILVSRLNPRHIVYEIFSTQTHLKHSGLISAPLYFSAQTLRRRFYPAINKVSFTIYQDNRDARQLLQHVMKNICCTEQINEVYIL